MTITSDVIVLVMLDVCVGELQVRYLDRRSQANKYKLRDLTSSSALTYYCVLVTLSNSFWRDLLADFRALISATAISPRPHWIPFDLQS